MVEYANGRYPDSALAAIPGGRLAKVEAALWNLYVEDFYRRHGFTPLPNGPDSTYRPFDRQVYYKAYWCGQGHCENAATPGESNHGTGKAGDLRQAVIDDLAAGHGRRFGILKAWSDAPWEPWHHLVRVDMADPAVLAEAKRRALTAPDPLTKTERRLVGELSRLRRAGHWTKARKARANKIKRWLLDQSHRIQREARRTGWNKAHRAARFRILRDAYFRVHH